METIETLLTPLDGPEPSGPDLRYDPEFAELEKAVRGKPSEQYGDTVIAAQEPEWRGILSSAEQLLARTKDLRIAFIWARAATRTAGFDGFCRGMALIEGLLTRLWPSVHPQLDAEDNNDPTMRLNALAGLADPEGMVADVRAAWLGQRAGTGALRVRDLELALGHGQPSADEVVPTEAGVRAALGELLAQQAQLLQQYVAADGHVAAIASTLDSNAAAVPAPDLQRLRDLTRLVAKATKEAAPEPETAAEGGTDAASASGSAGGVGLKGRIDSREDALQALDRVCEWLARAEPTNPAPLVIRRAKRLMTMNFLEIVRDVAPGAVDQVLSLIGADADQT